MVKPLKMRQAGASVSVTLPKEMAERFRIKPGDDVFAVDTEVGILITPYDSVFATAMNVYETGARRYRDALRVLAK